MTVRRQRHLSGYSNASCFSSTVSGILNSCVKRLETLVRIQTTGLAYLVPT